MPKIFRVLEQLEARWEVDPTRGAVKRLTSVVKESGDVRLKFKDREFEIGEDGSFDVDDETARFLLGRNGWHEGESPFAAEHLKKAAEKKAKAETEAKAEPKKGRAKKDEGAAPAESAQ